MFVSREHQDALDRVSELETTVRTEQLTVQRFADALTQIMALSECRCELPWTSRGRHMTECPWEIHDTAKEALKP